MQIETDRLLLVAWSTDFLDALSDSHAAAAALLGVTLPPEWPGPDLPDLLPAYAAALAADPGELGYGPWLVILRDERVAVGDAGFMGGPGDAGEVELGYGVLPGYRGLGYATEAAAALVAWALGQPRVRRIIARCEPANAASVRVLEKLGLEREGERDGLLCFALER